MSDHARVEALLADLPLSVRARLHYLDRLIDECAHAGHDVMEHVPAWARVTAAEHRIGMALVVGVAVALQASLPSYLTIQPRWVPLLVQGALLVALYALNPGRIVHAPRLRLVSMALTGVLSLANAASAVLLIRDLVTKSHPMDASTLLRAGGAVWLTNVIVFALWYWELDRGGPGERAAATHAHPDFLFPQMQQPELADPAWEPRVLDYVYVSFTNAMAFSPTDTLPLSRWAKMLMLLQSAVSLSVVALVVARGVNVLQ